MIFPYLTPRDNALRIKQDEEELMARLMYEARMAELQHQQDNATDVGPTRADPYGQYKACQPQPSAPSEPDTFFPAAWEPTNLSLEYILDQTGFFAYDNSISYPGITSMVWDKLVTSREGVDIEACPDLVSISFPVLTTMTENGYLQVSDSPNLTTVDIPVMASNVGGCTFSGNALSQACVDKILADLVATGYSGDLDLSGGTNSPPSDTGPTSNYATLVARGGTITTN